MSNFGALICIVVYALCAVLLPKQGDCVEFPGEVMRVWEEYRESFSNCRIESYHINPSGETTATTVYKMHRDGAVVEGESALFSPGDPGFVCFGRNDSYSFKILKASSESKWMLSELREPDEDSRDSVIAIVTQASESPALIGMRLGGDLLPELIASGDLHLVSRTNESGLEMFVLESKGEMTGAYIVQCELALDPGNNWLVREGSFERAFEGGLSHESFRCEFDTTDGYSRVIGFESEVTNEIEGRDNTTFKYRFKYVFLDSPVVADELRLTAYGISEPESDHTLQRISVGVLLMVLGIVCLYWTRRRSEAT